MIDSPALRRTHARTLQQLLRHCIYLGSRYTAVHLAPVAGLLRAYSTTFTNTRTGYALLWFIRLRCVPAFVALRIRDLPSPDLAPLPFFPATPSFLSYPSPFIHYLPSHTTHAHYLTHSALPTYIHTLYLISCIFITPAPLRPSTTFHYLPLGGWVVVGWLYSTPPHTAAAISATAFCLLPTRIATATVPPYTLPHPHAFHTLALPHTFHTCHTGYRSLPLPTAFPYILPRTLPTTAHFLHTLPICPSCLPACLQHHIFYTAFFVPLLHLPYATHSHFTAYYSSHISGWIVDHSLPSALLTCHYLPHTFYYILLHSRTAHCHYHVHITPMTHTPHLSFLPFCVPHAHTLHLDSGPTFIHLPAFYHTHFLTPLLYYPLVHFTCTRVLHTLHTSICLILRYILPFTHL